MVSKLKHENFVELTGYCVEGHNRVLSYEFATMGSLHDILHGNNIFLAAVSYNLKLVRLFFFFLWYSFKCLEK